MRKAHLMLSLLLLLGACASAGGIGRPMRRPDILMEDQIRGQSFASVYDAVVALRPNWLRTRGPDSFRSPTEVQVYIDNMRVGGVSNLRQISTLSTYYIQWFNGLEASARWGLGHGSGAIYVSTTPMRY